MSTFNGTPYPIRSIADVAAINPRRPKRLNDLPDDLPVSFIPMSAVDEVMGLVTEPEERPLTEVRKGYTTFENGDVLFAKITPCMQNGKAAIAYDLVSGLGFGSTEFHVLRPGPEILPEWLHYFVRQPAFRYEAMRHFRGSAGQQRVPAEFLGTSEIPLPPLDEQRRLVARIEACLERVEEARRLRQEAQREAEAVFPSSLAATLEEVGQDAQSATIGDIAEETRLGTSQKCREREDGMPILRIPNVADREILLDDLKYCGSLTKKDQAKLRLQRGDILIVRSNGSPSLVGRSAVVEMEDAERYGFASYLIRLRVDPSQADPHYVNYFLTSSLGRRAIDAISRSSSGLYNVSSANLREIKLPLPSLDRQRELVERMHQQRAAAQRLSAIQQEGRDEVEALPAAVLRKAFAGEL